MEARGGLMVVVDKFITYLPIPSSEVLVAPPMVALVLVGYHQSAKTQLDISSNLLLLLMNVSHKSNSSFVAAYETLVH
ncbi:hypothetical protein ACFX15_036217 [Malus domestica]